MLLVVHLITLDEYKQGDNKGVDVMGGLLEDGFGLMVLGMGFVFLFLVILIYATSYMSRLLNHFFPELPPVSAPSATPKPIDKSVVDAKLAAVITAAVHQHRNNQKH
jgi:oxaloacetate decarboxylase gamma subunit